MSSESLLKFVEALQKGESVTQNWDFAVSYNAKKINERLANSFEKQRGSGMIKEFTISFEDKDRLGDFTQFYHLRVGPPLIQFVPTTADPTCSLTMRVVGGETWTKDSTGESEKQILPTNTYQIALHGLLLAAAQGSVIVKDRVITVPAPNTFDTASKPTEIVVCLDFSTRSEYLAVNVVLPDGDNSAMANSKLPTYIRNVLEKSEAGIHYVLAVVTNEPPPDHVLDLIPHKFIFTTYAPERDSPGTSLTVLIQTKLSDRPEGDTKNVQAAWINTWTRLDTSPIPKGYSAVIVINNSFFTQNYIRKGLDALNMTGLQEQVAEQGGMRVTGKWPHPLRREKITEGTPPDMNRLPSKPTLYTMEVPTTDYHPNEGGRPFTVTFGQANGTDKPGTIDVAWSWIFNDRWQGEEWWMKVRSEEGGMSIRYPESRLVTGTYKVDYELNKTFESPTVDDEQFSIAVQVNDDDWNIRATPTTNVDGWTSFCNFFSFMTRQSNSIPTWVLDHIPIPTFTLDLHTLRFFMLTNVLLPGEKLIKVDSDIGMLFPRDVVIVGDVIED